MLCGIWLKQHPASVFDPEPPLDLPKSSHRQREIGHLTAPLIGQSVGGPAPKLTDRTGSTKPASKWRRCGNYEMEAAVKVLRRESPFEFVD